MTVTPRPSRKLLLGFLPLTILLVGQFGFRATDTILKATSEVAPQEHWDKAQWKDAHYLFPRGWKLDSTNSNQLTFLPDNSADSDKVQMSLAYVPSEDFGRHSVLERYVRQDIGGAKTVSVSPPWEARLGCGYDGLIERVITRNERGENVYHWYFMIEGDEQNRLLRFTAVSPERRTRYQKDFNRFMNNLTFDVAPKYYGPIVSPEDYNTGRQVVMNDETAHG